MRLDSKFSVSKPLGNLVLLKRFLRPFKGALVNLEPGLGAETPAERQGRDCACQYLHRSSSSYVHVMYPSTFKVSPARMSLEIDHRFQLTLIEPWVAVIKKNREPSRLG